MKIGEYLPASRRGNFEISPENRRYRFSGPKPPGDPRLTLKRPLPRGLFEGQSGVALAVARRLAAARNSGLAFVARRAGRCAAAAAAALRRSRRSGSSFFPGECAPGGGGGGAPSRPVFAGEARISGRGSTRR